MRPTTEMTSEQLVDELAASRHALNQKDRDFASSLLDQFSRSRVLSERQWPWVAKLVERARGAGAPPAAKPTLAFSAIADLFERAGRKLARPAVVLRCPAAASGEVRIKLAGASSREPGSLVVVDNAGGFGATYYGRISRDGTLTLSRAVDPGAAVEISGLLSRFSADPAGVAAADGRLAGRCCFCARGLTDDRSTTVGYGPVCADRFGLPWGAAEGALSSAAA